MSLQVPPNCDLTLGLRALDTTQQGRSVWTMAADERFANPAGLVQGGFLSAMADSAMGACAVSSVGSRRVYVSNTDLRISFVRPVRPGCTLTCTAETLRAGRSVIALAARIEDDEGTLVATASSTYVVRERRE